MEIAARFTYLSNLSEVNHRRDVSLLLVRATGENTGRIADHGAASVGLVGRDHGNVTLKHDRLHDEVFDRSAASIDPHDKFSAFEGENAMGSGNQPS